VKNTQKKNRGALRRRRRVAAAEAILDAAEAVLARRGYERAAVQDVARAAGCAVGTLYLYFKNKEELVAGIISRHSTRLGRRMMETLAGPAEPIRKIRRNLENLLDYFNEHQDAFYIFYTAAPAGASVPLGDLCTRLHGQGRAPRDYEALCRAEISLIRDAQRRGQVRGDMEPDHIQRFMHGLTMGVLGSWSLARRAPPRGAQSRMLWAFMTGGIGAREDIDVP
jgi:TetR/AcrR family transcriptional regulator, fatty acid metabolism regulator protein